ncbi:fluoride efflux transporter FluC [Pseudobacteriovorax antillogorgiicola]|nr:CrcB family protein [Pseudobacteriovorax antillogorgiicola]
MQVLWISGGAIIGALTRYGAQLLIAQWTPLPAGTLLVNLLGCFGIGYVYGIAQSWPLDVRLGLVTGLLGALTTMSSFVMDLFQMAEQRRWWLLTAWILVTVVGGFICCALGVFLGQRQVA